MASGPMTREQMIDRAVRIAKVRKPIIFSYIRLASNKAWGWNMFAEAVRNEFKG